MVVFLLTNNLFGYKSWKIDLILNSQFDAIKRVHFAIIDLKNEI